MISAVLLAWPLHCLLTEFLNTYFRVKVTKYSYTVCIATDRLRHCAWLNVIVRHKTPPCIDTDRECLRKGYRLSKLQGYRLSRTPWSYTVALPHMQLWIQAVHSRKPRTSKISIVKLVQIGRFVVRLVVVVGLLLAAVGIIRWMRLEAVSVLRRCNVRVHSRVAAISN